MMGCDLFGISDEEGKLAASETHGHEKRSHIFLKFIDVLIFLHLFFSFGFMGFRLSQKFGSLVYLKYPKLTHLSEKKDYII